MPMEERMLQRKLTLVPSLFAVVSISSVISTGAARASEKCLTAPNATAPRDEHWYYRTDRATNRQCWYLAQQDSTVRKRAAEQAKLSGSQLPLPLQAPLNTRSPNGKALDGTSDASESEPKLPAPESTIEWPEPAKSPDIPPSFERKVPRSTDLIGSAPPPASSSVDPLHVATPAQAAIEADHPSPVIVLTLALLALSGPMYHAVRWLRRRKARGRWNTERSYCSNLNARTETDRNADSRAQIGETLQQLLNEMQTALYGTSGPVRPIAERELDQNRISETNQYSGDWSVRFSPVQRNVRQGPQADIETPTTATF